MCGYVVHYSVGLRSFSHLCPLTVLYHHVCSAKMAPTAHEVQANGTWKCGNWYETLEWKWRTRTTLELTGCVAWS